MVMTSAWPSRTTRYETFDLVSSTMRTTFGLGSRRCILGNRSRVYKHAGRCSVRIGVCQACPLRVLSFQSRILLEPGPARHGLGVWRYFEHQGIAVNRRAVTGTGSNADLDS